MLFDPKWEVEASEKLLTLERLIEWLKTQDPNTVYDWYDPASCLITQYLRANGYPYTVSGGTYSRLYGKGTVSIDWPASFTNIAMMGKSTFGAALERCTQEMNNALGSE